jgi:hypothetical protein
MGHGCLMMKRNRSDQRDRALSLKLGDGWNREAAYRGFLTPPLLHRGSDMPGSTTMSSDLGRNRNTDGRKRKLLKRKAGRPEADPSGEDSVDSELNCGPFQKAAVGGNSGQAS